MFCYYDYCDYYYYYFLRSYRYYYLGVIFRVFQGLDRVFGMRIQGSPSGVEGQRFDV